MVNNIINSIHSLTPSVHTPSRQNRMYPKTQRISSVHLDLQELTTSIQRPRGISSIQAETSKN